MTLPEFAKKYGVTVGEVMKLNNKSRSTLQDWLKDNPELLASVMIGTYIRLKSSVAIVGCKYITFGDGIGEEHF